jgi:hypothetical protein
MRPVSTTAFRMSVCIGLAPLAWATALCVTSFGVTNPGSGVLTNDWALRVIS